MELDLDALKEGNKFHRDSCDVSTRASPSDQRSEQGGEWVASTTEVICEETQEALLEIMAMLDGDDEEHEAAIEALAGSVAELAFDGASSRVMQRALQVAALDVAAALLGELRGRVLEACYCPHANHVLQRALERLPPQSIEFIFEELSVASVDVARHQFGSRIMLRVARMRSSYASCACDFIVNQLLAKAAKLTNHVHGTHVAQALLQYGSTHEIALMTAALAGRAVQHARSKSGFHFVKSALECATGDARAVLENELFDSAETLVTLGENQFGCQVAKAYLQMSCARPELLTRFLPDAKSGPVR